MPCLYNRSTRSFTIANLYAVLSHIDHEVLQILQLPAHFPGQVHGKNRIPGHEFPDRFTLEGDNPCVPQYGFHDDRGYRTLPDILLPKKIILPGYTQCTEPTGL